MRLVTLAHGESTTAAVLGDGGSSPVGNGAFPDVGALLRAGEEGLETAREVLAEGRFSAYELEALRRPVLTPGAIVCVGLNYKPHILEMGRELPEYPTLFAKLPRVLTDPFAEIVLPEASSRVQETHRSASHAAIRPCSARRPVGSWRKKEKRTVAEICPRRSRWLSSGKL